MVTIQPTCVQIIDKGDILHQCQRLKNHAISGQHKESRRTAPESSIYEKEKKAVILPQVHPQVSSTLFRLVPDSPGVSSNFDDHPSLVAGD